MQHNKKKWLDHVVDQDGAVVQQGTLISAGNMNPLEAGLANAAIEINNNAAAVREAMPSGKTKLSTLDFGYAATNPNKIRLNVGGVAFVHGFKIDIPDLTIVDLGAPPTEGTRDDLVFLEVWRALPGDTTGETINSRIRVVPGVNFTTYPDGMGIGSMAVSRANLSPIHAQGGQAAPVVDDWYRFRPAVNNKNHYDANGQNIDDVGLFVAGRTGFNSVATADGYVYAIPLFRVRRRNSGPYSVTNPNGGPARYTAALRYGEVDSAAAITYYTGQEVIIRASSNYSLIQTGDILVHANFPTIMFKVVEKLADNKIRVGCVGAITTGYQNIDFTFTLLSTRPDKLYNDIVADRDVIDLRHKVSLTGFNHQALLEENFDKLLSGELQTKDRKKMLKVYHGIRKTPIDANTLFYASMDGITEAEVGGAPLETAGTLLHTAAATGLGLNVRNGTYLTFAYAKNPVDTADFWYRPDLGNMPTNEAYLFRFLKPGGSSTFAAIRYVPSTKRFYVNVFNEGNMVYSSPTFALTDGLFNHVRFITKSDRVIVYVNGIKVVDAAVSLAAYTIISIGNTSSGWAALGTVCDLSIGNIDRGDVFATLPKDYVDKYAVITAAMNGQRKTHSDALTGQYTVGIAKGVGSGHSKGVTKTQAVADSWASGDTVKVKALAGGLIGGVIDADTALATVTEAGGGITVVKVDDVSKLVVNDVVKYYRISDGTLVDRTITAIDTVNKTITISASTTVYVGDLFLEITASTSSPLIKFMNAGTLTTATGTWAGLGTNEATFTLGTNASLVNADLQVEYSLNMIPGQGGVPEVYTATLAGEAKGKKLIIGTAAVRDDFKDKVAASTVVNPNAAKKIAAATLQAPSSFVTELGQAEYDNSKMLDGTTTSMATSVNGEIAQQFFSFDLVKMVEAKYGPIPSVDKVGWLRVNLSKVTCNWYGYGAGPSGDKAKFSEYYNGAWNTAVEHTNPTVAKLGKATTGVTNVINSDGQAYYVAYTDASNGAVASTVHTDYVEIEVELKTPAGYDVLVPENPRRDGGLTNVLLVRRETKEIVSFFDAVNTDDLVTYGDFVPYQGIAVHGITTPRFLRQPASAIKAYLTSIGTGNVPSGGFNLENGYKALSTKLPIGGHAVNPKDFQLTANRFKVEDKLVYFTEVDLTTDPFNTSISFAPLFNHIGGNTGGFSTTPGTGGGWERGVNSAFVYSYSGYGLTNLTAKEAISKEANTNLLSIVAAIAVGTDGEIYLIVWTNTGHATQLWNYTGQVGAADVFRLTGKPLVKGV